jgi:hypothetical protein
MLDPPARYAVVYLGSTIKVCFAETILRDQGDGRSYPLPVEWKELESWICAELRVEQVLNLVDLRGDGLIRMGIPTDVVRARSQYLARIWARAIWRHDMRPDGMIYDSRLNGETNIVVFDRGLPKLHPAEQKPLVGYRSELAAIFDDFDLAVV